jgi:CubicO group peptidase (beta-lactamase class C family)
MPSRLVLALLAALISPALLRADTPKQLDGLDAFIADVMKEANVPGLALAVVQDGKPVLLRGYGLRDVEKKLPVTPKTLFAIGSITKSFTVTGLGMLVEEKKLDWDRPVRDYLADFRLHDRALADRVTPRDLVTHRTGLPRHDSMWYLTKLGRREMYERLRHLEPSKDLRDSFQYNNLMYMTAGVLLEKASGQSWEDFTRKRLFAPLGMTRSNVSVEESKMADDVALPYRDKGGERRAIPFRNIDPMAPAGSINSCVEDMSKYLLMHLAMGKHGEKQLLARSQAEEMQAPQMVIPLAGQKQNPFITPGDDSYGLGFTVGRHRGERMVSHGGSIDGFLAQLAFLPQKKVGVVVLTNLTKRDFAPVPMVVVHEVFERMLGQTGIDWRERGRQMTKNAVKQRDERKARLAKDRKKDTTPTHKLEELAGTYEHPAHGPLQVKADDKGLKLVFSGATVAARHYHFNTFEVFDTDEHPAAMLEDRQVTFHVGRDGRIDRVAVQLELGVGDFVFRRVGKKAGG